MGFKIDPKKLFTKDKLPLILLFGILIAIISIPVKKSENNIKDETDFSTKEISNEDYVTDLEQRLEEILESTEGVGKAKVMITVMDNGKEVLYSQWDISKSSITENDSNGSSVIKEESNEIESVLYTEEDGVNIPYVQKEEMPRIQGVVIIAQGAGKADITAEISEAASTLLGIPINKIKVLKMEV